LATLTTGPLQFMKPSYGGQEAALLAGYRRAQTKKLQTTALPSAASPFLFCLSGVDDSAPG